MSAVDLSPQERFAITAELLDFAIETIRSRYQREHPGAERQAVDRAVQRWLLAPSVTESGDLDFPEPR